MKPSPWDWIRLWKRLGSGLRVIGQTYPCLVKMNLGKIMHGLLHIQIIHPPLTTSKTSASPCSHNMKCAWQPFFSLLPFTPRYFRTTMHETRRLVEAAAALSLLLRNRGIPHAFYGNIVSAVLANTPLSDASILTISQSPLIFNSLTCRRFFVLLKAARIKLTLFVELEMLLPAMKTSLWRILHGLIGGWSMQSSPFRHSSVQSGCTSRIVVWFRRSK